MPSYCFNFMSIDPKNYRLFAVDAVGVARATYDFRCLDDDEAKRRAETYLHVHDAVELWAEHRQVARLKRKMDG